jgi:DNA-binding CsgD family transcriptional regulator
VNDPSSRDLRATQNAIRVLLDCAQPHEVLDQGLEALSGLVAVDFAAMNWLDPATATVVARSWPPEALPAMRTSDRASMHAHPLTAAALRAPFQEALRISDVMGDLEWRHHPVRSHMCQLAGRQPQRALERQVGVATIRDGVVLAIAANRNGMEFDDRERALTGLLGQAVTRIHHLIETKAATEALLAEAAEAPGPLVVVDQIGRPVAGTRRGKNLYESIRGAQTPASGASGLASNHRRVGEELQPPSLPAGYRLIRLNPECDLTPREVEVLSLASRGATTQAIARRLGNQPRTVDKHLERSYRKLGATDRASAVRRALELGLFHGQRPPSD